jgi:SAM-dependent methyltransferase
VKRHAPATARNGGPLGDVLAQELPATGLVLEVASGSGEHALLFARRFPLLDWQPSDPDAEALASIAAWREVDGPRNLRAPIRLDAAEPAWPVVRADAVLCVNMIHITPWSATEGLMAGAGRLLAPGGPLVVYGPFVEAEVETAASNLAFDADLRRRDPRWGLREGSALDRLAGSHGFARTARHAMPANNLALVYRRNQLE